MSIYIKLLGSPVIYHNDNILEPTTTKQHALLYYLVIQGDWVNREVIADLFWQLDDKNSRNNLRVMLTKLKKEADFDWADSLEIENTRLRLLLDNDVNAFSKANNEKQWAKIQSLYQGLLLDNVNIRNAPHFYEWLELERQTLNNQWREALITQAKLWEEKGHFDDARTLMQTLLEDDPDPPYPYAEDALLNLLRYADQSGAYDEALLHYQSIKKQLAQDGLEASESAQKLAKKLEAKRQQKALIVKDKPVQHTLPVQSNTFIGRDMELVDIAALLGKTDCRLLTLVGLGGIGKTRLALQISEYQREHFADGVHFILLAALQSTNNLAATILNTLKTSLSVGQTPEDSLLENLKDKAILLALDNFEHLLEGAPLLGTLLEKTKNLKFLVTSREPLNLTWEHTFEVLGLRYPEGANTKDFAQYDAVRLFTRTAQQVNSRFQLEAEYYPAVLEICQIVEGMPLGLELAASWVQTFSCQQIAQMLAENIGIIESTLKDIPERHRSLDHVFEYSWRLLSKIEQNVLSKLAVFRGGFDKEAVRAITNASYITLVQLKQKSLVRKVGEERFDMHEVIRQGAEKKLKENDNTYQEARVKHTHYYLDFVANNNEEVQASQIETIRALEIDLDNIREAWYWAVYKLDADTLYSSLTPIHRFHINQGRFQEALELYNYAEKYFNQDKGKKHLFFPSLLHRKAWCLGKLGYAQESIIYDKRSLELSRYLNNINGMITSLHSLGVSERRIGNNLQARVVWQEALELSKKNNKILMFNILSNLSILEEQEGNYEQAEVYYRNALYASQQSGEIGNYLKHLNNLATFLLNTGRSDEAEELSKEGIHLAGKINQEENLPYFLLKLARVANHQGNNNKAWQLAQQALVLSLEQNNKPYCAKIYHFLGDIAIATRQFLQGQEYLKQGLQLAKDIESPSLIHDLLFSIAKYYSSQEQNKKATSLLQLLLQQSPLVKVTEKNIINLLNTLSAEVNSAIELAEVKHQTQTNATDLKGFVEEFLQYNR